jgi:hypothetical protein
MSAIRLAIVLIVLLTGVAAAVSTATKPQGCPPVAVSDTLRLAVGRREDNALIGDATIQLAEPAPIYIEYGNDKVDWLRTQTTEPGQVHQLPILRLRPATTYQVHAFAVSSSGCPYAGARAEFTSGDLPPQFRKLSVETSGRPSFPLTITDVRLMEGDSRGLNEVRGYVAFDEMGYPVWYYRLSQQTLRASRTSRLSNLVQMASGNLIYLVNNFGIEEITADGRLVRRVRIPDAHPHHEVLPLDETRMLVLGYEERVIDYPSERGRRSQRVRGDTLVVVDLDNGTQQRVWTAFDALDPTEPPRRSRGPDDEEDDVFDWTHSNSLHVGPRGNILMSVRWLDQVISLSPDFQAIEWKLGGSRDGGHFAFLDPADRFYGQHTASQLPNGHILLFDNGDQRPDGDYSRALELELDFETMVARKAWEYRHQPDLHSVQISSVARLPSGNTLVHFGFPADADGPVVTVEARPDGTAASTLAMRIEGQRTTSYRAYPLWSLAGESTTRPTALAAR